MPEVVTVSAVAPTAPVAAAAPPVVDARPSAPAAPLDRKAAALAVLHKDKPVSDPAAPASDEKKVDAATTDDKPTEPAKSAEDPEEKLHSAFAKLNRREAEIRQRETTFKRQIEASKADQAELAELRALKAMIVENPRAAIKKAAGDDKENDVFNKYVGQVAATPEQQRLEEMQARIDKLERDRVESEKRTKDEDASKTVQRVVQEYRGGIARELQTSPEKFQNANIAAQTREVFEIFEAQDGRPAVYGNIYDLALNVADQHAIRTKQVMSHAQALDIVEAHLAEREASRQNLRKPAPAAAPTQEAVEEKKPLAVPARPRPITVRHTLSNAMQGNAGARVVKATKNMSRDERLKHSLQYLPRK